MHGALELHLIQKVGSLTVLVLLWHVQGDPSCQFKPPVDLVLTAQTAGRLPWQDGTISKIQVNGRIFPAR